MIKCNNPKCGFESKWENRHRICPKCGFVMHPYKEKKPVSKPVKEIELEDINGNK